MKGRRGEYQEMIVGIVQAVGILQVRARVIITMLVKVIVDSDSEGWSDWRPDSTTSYVFLKTPEPQPLLQSTNPNAPTGASPRKLHSRTRMQSGRF